MKYRNGFISNSSSTSFIITNNTRHILSLEDFVKENAYLVDGFNVDCLSPILMDDMLECEEIRYINLDPGNNEILFSDEGVNAVHDCYNVMLRVPGKSKRFSWKINKDQDGWR
jgi:hypothetical protein